MKLPGRWKICAWIALAACSKDGTVPGPNASASSSPSVASAASSSSAMPPVASASSSIAASGFHLELGSPGTVILENDGNVAVRIAWDLPIERNDGGKWTTAVPMELKQKCFESPPADSCVTIAAHSSFTPRPWTGWFGCTQCGTCDANAPAPAGSYRFVAIECDSKTRHESAPLEVVDEGRFAHTAHVFAPKSDPSTIEIDNESDEPVSFQTAVNVSRLDRKRGAFDEVPNAGMVLMSACASPVPACVTVAPHASLHTMAFHPGCQLCKPCAAPVAPGELQFRVTVCDTQKPLYNDVYGANFYTKPFVVDGKGHVSQP